jgi:hypothetical protein
MNASLDEASSAPKHSYGNSNSNNDNHKNNYSNNNDNNNNNNNSNDNAPCIPSTTSSIPSTAAAVLLLS